MDDHNDSADDILDLPATREFLANVRRFCPTLAEHSDSDVLSIARDLAGLAYSGAFGAVYDLGESLGVPASEWNLFAYEVLATLYPVAVCSSE